MVFYTCPKCNKIFTKKSHFLNHAELKKKPCQPIQENLILNNPQLILSSGWRTGG